VASLGTIILGCSTNASTQQRNLTAVLKARGLEPAAIVYPNRLTPEMRRWLDERFPRSSPSEYNAFRLLQFLEGEDGLGLEYEAGYTGTAAEVFATRKYNCLSFSHLYLAMAREIGVDARYLSVERIRRYQQRGDVIVVSGHITVGFGVGLDHRVLEFNVGPTVNYKTATQISDVTAVALYHSNRGAELIQLGRHGEAIEWLETAVKLDPHVAGSWVNLGVARRRSGDVDAAADAYLHAIDIDSKHYSAYRNLASLYKMQGDRDAAREMFAELDRRGNRNPFAYLALGDQSLELRRFREAEGYYRRALKLSTNRSEAQAALGLLALESGAVEAARDWYEKANKSNPESKRVSNLERRLTATPADASQADSEMRID